MFNLGILLIGSSSFMFLLLVIDIMYSYVERRKKLHRQHIAALRKKHNINAHNAHNTYLIY